MALNPIPSFSLFLRPVNCSPICHHIPITMRPRLFSILFLAVVLFRIPLHAQSGAVAWTDSVMRSLSEDQKIAQLIIVRYSSIDLKTRVVTFYDSVVNESVSKYNVGGICLFQGGPVRQVSFVNAMQRAAKTPLLISIDGENGVGMRVDSVDGLPRQMMLGAVNDPKIIYRYGQWVGEQCKRMGIQVNYAPVVDVNNNPDNPIINDRSFGENKFKVTEFGIQYMKGMQDAGIMACAKHFPGHGDVAVDSHLDMPVIAKSMDQLDSMELYPFRSLFQAGVYSTMVSHLFVPAIDSLPNHASSISPATITGLLRNRMGFQGLTFTDALEMKGIAKYYPDGAAAVESLVAGNDMLCLPGDVPMVIAKIRDAIRAGRISWTDIDTHLRRVLMAKFAFGLSRWQPQDTSHIKDDLNRNSDAIRRVVAEKAITLVHYSDRSSFPLPTSRSRRVVCVAIGTATENTFTRRMRSDHNADVFFFDFNQGMERIPSTIELIRQRYDAVVISLHGFARFPANHFGISPAAMALLKELKEVKPSTLFVFGNPYVIKDLCDQGNIIACYDDHRITQEVAADMLKGTLGISGTLPVRVCQAFAAGSGIALQAAEPLRAVESGVDFSALDSIAIDAIRQKAAPGCVILVAKDGRIVYHKAFGHYTYDSTERTTLGSIYDMASVTKICATTLSIMKLYDQGKLSLDKKLGDYLPWVKGSDKENLRIQEILLHQARLKAFIPFYRETIDTTTGEPLPGFYSRTASSKFPIRVADSMFMRADWRDTLYSRILKSPLEKPGTYIYSDNDFIFLGKVVESISGMPLDEYVVKEFYRPMGLNTAGFKPRNRFPAGSIAPTEKEKLFRLQLIRGDVHDPGAAMFGGVAGHAGLFSNAADIATLMQMVMNGGVLNGRRYFSDSTVRRFTAYHSSISRRGYGFDKPEKDNNSRKEPYPCLSASPSTFGHTGFTGTCAWADPEKGIVFVFLSNRVHPDPGPKLGAMNVRGKLQEAVYCAYGLSVNGHQR